MTATSKIVLVFAGIFLAGCVTGGFASLRIFKTYVKSKVEPDQFPARHVLWVSRNIKTLTPDQKARIEAIMAEENDEWVRLRKDHDEFFKRLNVRIMAELTPEQKAEYDEMLKKFRERMRRPGGPGGPGQGPPRDDLKLKIMKGSPQKAVPEKP